VNVLLDTCALLWLAGEPERLSPSARAVLDDASNRLFVSDVTVWEIVLKHHLSR
jgi:PIN domain nuclease of toxin-antitoxin system